MNPLTGDRALPTIDAALYAARRCHCRPGCLTEIRPGDQVIQTPAGAALAAHAPASRS